MKQSTVNILASYVDSLHSIIYIKYFDLQTIVFVAVENGKVLKQAVEGELTPYEAANAMEETTMATVAGIAASTQATQIGSSIGMVLGPPGAVVGGIIGSVIGYMAGSMVGRLAARGRQMMRNFTGEILGIARKNMKDIWDSARIGLAEVFG